MSDGIRIDFCFLLMRLNAMKKSQGFIVIWKFTLYCLIMSGLTILASLKRSVKDLLLTYLQGRSKY